MLPNLLGLLERGIAQVQYYIVGSISRIVLSVWFLFFEQYYLLIGGNFLLGLFHQMYCEVCEEDADYHKYQISLIHLFPFVAVFRIDYIKIREWTSEKQLNDSTSYLSRVIFVLRIEILGKVFTLFSRE